MAEVILALDYPTADGARELVDRLGDDAGFYKVGLQLFTAAGPDLVRELVDRGKSVFLDLKLHDIPNTVARAVAEAVTLDVDLVTVHAAGGRPMLEAARDAAGDGVRVVAVTVLTSLTPGDVEAVFGRQIDSVREEVLRLARLAVEDAGLDGVVASALEASWLRSSLGDDPLIVTPGIRPAGADADDQARVASPAGAVRAGSDYLVIGRSVTEAPDPSEALAGILAEIEGA